MRTSKIIISMITVFYLHTVHGKPWHATWLQYSEPLAECCSEESLATEIVSNGSGRSKFLLKLLPSNKYVALIPLDRIADSETANFLKNPETSLRWKARLVYWLLKDKIPFRILDPYSGNIREVAKIPTVFAEVLALTFKRSRYEIFFEKLISRLGDLDHDFPKITPEHLTYREKPVLKKLLEQLSLEDLEKLRLQGFDQIPAEIEEILLRLLREEFRGGKKANYHFVEKRLGADQTAALLSGVSNSDTDKQYGKYLLQSCYTQFDANKPKETLLWRYLTNR